MLSGYARFVCRVFLTFHVGIVQAVTNTTSDILFADGSICTVPNVNIGNGTDLPEEHDASTGIETV